MKTKYLVLATAVLFAAALSFRLTLASSKDPFNGNQVITLANQDRQSNSLPSLKENQQLDLAAALKLDDMIQNGYFGHVSPQGVTPWYFIGKAGYVYENAGENLAESYTSPANLEQAWMASPEHKENILNPKFSEIGVAQKEAEINGQQTNIIVELFGNPDTIGLTVRN